MVTKEEITERDISMMRRALQLAAQGAGHVSPNPMVGAVITDATGRIIGEGWHRAYGGPHAEVQAFLDVQPDDEHLLKESTIYVTLEPCSHYGKTPPCAELLIRKGIARAVIGCGDPNPKVSGRGIRMLRDAGITVVENVLEDECRYLNRRFMTAQTLRRPWIELKWAQSADGFVAADNPAVSAPGESSYQPVALSTPVSAMLMHRERSMCDAIMVGTDTLITDNPSLTTRLWPGHSPRPVLFRSDRLPETLQILDRDPIWLDPALPLQENMELLFIRHGITSLMVEGGARLLESFIKAGLYDEIRVETSSSMLLSGLPAPALP